MNNFSKTMGILAVVVLLASCPSPSGGGTTGLPWDNDPEILVGGGSTTSTTYWGEINAAQPDSQNSLATTDADWYKDAVFYHLWVVAFADSNGDGLGDLQGIIDRLDYLQNDLGVTAIWLSPIFETASGNGNLHGYDATNLYRVDPRFGSNYRLQQLLRAAHQRGMRLIYDHVPNHVSSQHPWFQESQNVSSPKRNWFKWLSSRPTLPAWTGWDSYSDFHGPVNGAYYYGIFWDGMPDLNYDTPEVRQAMANVKRDWLNFGFDGIRMDAVKYIYEDWSKTDNTGYADQPATFTFWNKVREDIFDAYNSSFGGQHYHKFMVAENWESNQSNLLKYMKDGSNDGFHMTLDFPFAYAAAALHTNNLHSHWNWVKSSVEPADGWMGTFVSNHDNVVSRPMTNFMGDEGKVRAQTALLLLGVGTPFVYYGNEIGMSGAAGNDINLRQPLNWATVSTQKGQPQSLLNWHRHLINLRKTRASLRRGSYTLVHNSGGIYAFERSVGSERTLVVFNLNDSTQSTINLTLTSAPDVRITLLGTHDVGGTGNSVQVNNVVGYGVRVIALESGASGPTSIDDIPYNPPPPPTVYLRGSFNAWGITHPMTYNPVTQIYSVTINLSTGSHQFKFNTGSSWYGYTNSTYDPTVGGDTGLSFTDAGGNDHNIGYTSGTGNHTFYFSLNDAKFGLDAP